MTRLEQGRSTAPPTQVVESLARALRIADAERDLLFRLAGYTAPGPELVSSRITASVATTARPAGDHTGRGVRRHLDPAGGQPAVRRGGGSDHRLAGVERNSVWRNLVGADTRVVHTGSERADLAASLVADLRLTASRYPDDQRVHGLLDELAEHSPRFAELWRSGELPPHRDSGRRKTIDHPAVGRITLDCDTLIVAADDLRIMIYTGEPGTRDSELLDLAVVLGTQAMIRG